MKKNQGKEVSSYFVKTSTWTRDSHNLYDYETSGVHKKQFRISSSCIINRNVNEISVSEECEHDALVSITGDSQKYYVTSAHHSPIWLVIRNSRNAAEPFSYTLTEGTTIKLGRVQFRVKAIKTKEDTIEETVAEIGLGKDLICRVCLCEHISNENPLVSVCKCSGTMRYIHIECLQQWISSRITTNVTENSVMKYLKSIHCELCKVKLPFTITANSASYDLLKGQKPQVPYLILEGIQTELKEPGVYFINFLNKCSVMLGRGHDSDVRIPDISVSRCHAKISYNNEVFTIQDNYSKFGTLVMSKDPVQIRNNMAIQCGRTIMQFSLNGNNSENFKFDWEQE